MAEQWYIPGIGEVTTPSNPSSLPAGARRVDGGSSIQSTPTTTPKSTPVALSTVPDQEAPPHGLSKTKYITTNPTAIDDNI